MRTGLSEDLSLDSRCPRRNDPINAPKKKLVASANIGYRRAHAWAQWPTDVSLLRLIRIHWPPEGSAPDRNTTMPTLGAQVRAGVCYLGIHSHRPIRKENVAAPSNASKGLGRRGAPHGNT